MSVPQTRKSWYFRQLKWSLQSLAQAGSPQRPLFPEQATSADDLAFGFDHWNGVVRDLYGQEMTDDQSGALDVIDGKLRTMSRDGADFDVELWTERALGTSEHWADVRGMAMAALDAFGWGADYFGAGEH